MSNLTESTRLVSGDRLSAAQLPEAVQQSSSIMDQIAVTISDAVDYIDPTPVTEEQAVALSSVAAASGAVNFDVERRSMAEIRTSTARRMGTSAAPVVPDPVPRHWPRWRASQRRIGTPASS